jgi:hypothetical protein
MVLYDPAAMPIQLLWSEEAKALTLGLTLVEQLAQ